MSDNVGIWIDHRKAVIVSASADHTTIRTLESNVGPHSRYSGRAGSTMPEGGPQDEGGEKRYEERYGQHLDQYYDEVISHLGQPDADCQRQCLACGRQRAGRAGAAGLRRAKRVNLV